MGRTTHDYDIVTRLAVGNGALVYRGVDKITHRQVALKLLVQDENIDHRFHAEALLADAPLLMKITGAHVCQLLDAYEDEDGPVLVYEFAEGVSGEELPAKRKLDAAQALDIAAQLISALRSGERQRVANGDVKPSNVVIMELPDGRPFTVVLDWALTAYRAVVADDTLPCLAPERLHGAGASHRADLFSAGATLFFLCTGKTLITAKTRGEAETAWHSVTPTVLAELRPDLPAKFVQWICRLLELAPENRPASAVDALASLAALNPPPPPIPPESFRVRPTSGIGSGIASGIVLPPPRSAPPVSAIRERPPASSVSPSPEKPDGQPTIAPVKKSHVAMTVALFFGLLIAIAGAVWLFFFRKAEPVKFPDGAGERQARSESRPPAPSVGESIAKKPPTPPPAAAPAAATPKPAAPPKPKPKSQPTPKRTPTPPPKAAPKP